MKIINIETSHTGMRASSFNWLGHLFCHTQQIHLSVVLCWGWVWEFLCTLWGLRSHHVRKKTPLEIWYLIFLTIWSLCISTSPSKPLSPQVQARRTSPASWLGHSSCLELLYRKSVQLALFVMADTPRSWSLWQHNTDKLRRRPAAQCYSQSYQCLNYEHS